MFAEVAVPAPLTRALTYGVPPILGSALGPGCRVLVELGRRKVLGLVLGLTDKAPAGIDIKEILDVLDEEPAVPAELLQFLVELSSYYLAPLGEVMQLALPALERAEAERVTQREPTTALGHVVGGRRLRYVEAIGGSTSSSPPRRDPSSSPPRPSPEIPERGAEDGETAGRSNRGAPRLSSPPRPSPEIPERGAEDGETEVATLPLTPAPASPFVPPSPSAPVPPPPSAPSFSPVSALASPSPPPPSLLVPPPPSSILVPLAPTAASGAATSAAKTSRAEASAAKTSRAEASGAEASGAEASADAPAEAAVLPSSAPLSGISGEGRGGEDDGSRRGGEDKGKPLKGNAPAILEYLREHGMTPVARLVDRWPNARAALAKLEARGLVRSEEREVPRDPFFRDLVPRDEAPEPTPPQVLAMAAIDQALRAARRAAFLVHGVTGSGKTEVYLHAIATALELKRGVLVLVPEIALTPQLVARFRARFGDGLAVLHSGLSPRDRLAMWQSLRRRDVSVAIGARSALFAPVPDLGLVVVDEEHDPSFKQDEGVRYNGRDMALLRAHRAGAVCILGSATPSLETEFLSRTGKLTKLKLPARARVASVLPEVKVIDLRRAKRGPTGDPKLSEPLHQAMDEALGRGEQVILFLNRRGFAPSVLCEACGHIATCNLCSVSLTYHHRDRLVRCHYCDMQKPLMRRCDKCGSGLLSLEGLGTERLEDTIQKAFPSARVARLDRDIAPGSKAEPILEKLRAHEIDILIGTQMVAKGHDVPKVTLVGVINADSALSMPDMRATERTFQLLVQVAGRAGRGEVRGRVLLQTRDPDNPAIVFAARHDVDGFLERELRARSELAYPPYARLAMIRVDSPDQERGQSAALRLGMAARATGPSLRGEVEVLGPAPSPLERLRGRYRFQLLLKSRERRHLRTTALAILEEEKRLPAGVRVVLDIDPVSML